MSTKVILDTAVNFDFLLRKNNDSTIKMNCFNPNGSSFDLTGYTSQYVIYYSRGGAIYKTISATISANQVTITLSASDLSLNGNFFYEWQFTKALAMQTWFAGKHKVIVGAPDATTTNNVLTVTVNTNPTTISATINSSSLNYSEYACLITQVGTASPTATVLTNSITDTLTWSRSSAGKYKLSKINGFDLTKAFISFPLGVSLFLTPNYLRITFDTDNNILIETWNSNLDYTDGLLTSFPLEIKIFN